MRVCLGAGELGGDAIVDALDGTISPAGKMPVTTYHSNFTQRDIRVTDLRADGGVTYRWFSGPVQTRAPAAARTTVPLLRLARLD